MSKDPAQRGVAMVALRGFAPQETYDGILEVLATSDTSPSVRALAIESLGTSGSPSAATALNSIALDGDKPLSERQMAARSTTAIGIQTVLGHVDTSGDSTFVLAAAGATEVAWNIRDPDGDRGAFTSALRKGLLGGADRNRDGVVVASEAKEFVVATVRRTTPFQTPVVLERGEADIPLTTVGANRRFPFAAAYGLFVGTYPLDTKYLQLPSAIEDARSISTVFNHSIGLRVDTLLGDRATEASVREALRVAESAVQERDLFVFFFSGHASVAADGAVRWLLADSGISGGITAGELNTAFQKIRARHKVVLVDSCYAGGASDIITAVASP